MKKIIISIIVAFFVTVIIGISYVYNKPLKHNSSLKTISKNGVSFSYPKKFTFEDGSVSGFNSTYYSIANPLIDPPRRSTISISIPLDNTAKATPLSEEVKNISELRDFSLKKDITKININGHNGEMIIYTAFNADDPYPQAITTFTIQQLKSQYPMSPIEIRYTRIDVDSSIDKAWEIIQQTLKY